MAKGWVQFLMHIYIYIYFFFNVRVRNKLPGTGDGKVPGDYWKLKCTFKNSHSESRRDWKIRNAFLDESEEVPVL